MLQKRGATRGRAMGAVHKGSDAKPRANRRAVGGGRLLGPKQRGGGPRVGEAGLEPGGGRRRKATWLKCARWDGVFARQVEGWRAAHVCVCVWHRGGAECSGQVLPGQRQVSATAGARGALPPTRAAPGWQLGGPKLHSFHSGPVEVQQLVECRWTNRAVRSLSISNYDCF